MNTDYWFAKMKTSMKKINVALEILESGELDYDACIKELDGLRDLIKEFDEYETNYMNDVMKEGKELKSKFYDSIRERLFDVMLKAINK